MASLHRFFQEIIMDIDGRTALYKSVKLLSMELKAQLKKQRLSDAVYNAIRQLDAKLVDAMYLHDQRTNNGQKPSDPAFKQFAISCYNAIYCYQPQLMSAPGLWNQIKAYINNFLEKYGIYKPIFYTEHSELALNDEFRKQFNDLKRMYLTEDEEEQNCCFGL